MRLAYPFLACLACLGAFFSCGPLRADPPSPPPARAPLLLYYAANDDGGYTDRITPASFAPSDEAGRARLAHMLAMPFDGVAIASDPGWELMNGSARQPWTKARIDASFSPLAGKPTGRLRHNFAIVNVSKFGPGRGDFFDDATWKLIAANFSNLAASLRDCGIEGVLFDNEVYPDPVAGPFPLFDWPDDVEDKSRGLAEYQAMARARGRQVMEAMVGEYPAIVVIALHGPYISAPVSGAPGSAGNPFWPRQSAPEYCELSGPFTVGLAEGRGAAGTVVDGGEEYKFDGPSDFSASRAARSRTLAAGNGSFEVPGWIPEALRGDAWGRAFGIGFGVLVGDWPDAQVRTEPADLERRLRSALKNCDRYVWAYSEARDRRVMSPEGASPAWAEAIRRARR